MEFNRTAWPEPSVPSFKEDRNSGTSKVTYQLSDFWVGVVLALSLISCIGFMCTLFLYHKVQKWKAAATVHPLSVVEVRRTVEPDTSDADENLPDYTLVSGLPSYQQALDQLRQARQEANRRPSTTAMLGTLHYSTYQGRGHPTRLSVKDLLKSYKRSASANSLDDRRERHTAAVTAI